MGTVSALPSAEVQVWLTIRDDMLRPRLASLDVDPEEAEHVIAQIRIVYDKLGLGRSHPVVLESDAALAAYIEQVRARVMDLYLPLIIELVWELALRELALYRASTALKPSTADVIDFPPK